MRFWTLLPDAADSLSVAKVFNRQRSLLFRSRDPSNEGQARSDCWHNHEKLRNTLIIGRSCAHAFEQTRGGSGAWYAMELTELLPLIARALHVNWDERVGRRSLPPGSARTPPAAPCCPGWPPGQRPARAGLRPKLLTSEPLRLFVPAFERRTQDGRGHSLVLTRTRNGYDYVRKQRWVSAKMPLRLLRTLEASRHVLR